MDALLAALSESGPAQAIRFSRWGYAAVNTAHVASLAILVGAILPLDLRLLGAWRSVPLEPLARGPVPVAATGLGLALLTGLLLFSTRAPGYAGIDLFWVKLALIAAGSLHAIAVQAGPGLTALSDRSRRLSGGISLACWAGALVSGRFLAFVGD